MPYANTPDLSDPLLRALLALETAVRRKADDTNHRRAYNGVAKPLRTALRRLDVVRAETAKPPALLSNL